MNAETLKALNESIEHWQRLATGERQEGEGIWSEDCALCGLFNSHDTPASDVCKGCPVAEKTGRSQCDGTPYHLAHRAYITPGGNYDSEAFKYAAEDMLEFLKALRPSEQARRRPHEARGSDAST